MFKAKRRTVVTATAVVAVLLGGALAATLLTQGKTPQIYGTDHPTPDGTSVKDYVHVADLARAHAAAARALESGRELEKVYNLGGFKDWVESGGKVEK